MLVYCGSVKRLKQALRYTRGVNDLALWQKHLNDAQIETVLDRLLQREAKEGKG